MALGSERKQTGFGGSSDQRVSRLGSSIPQVASAVTMAQGHKDASGKPALSAQRDPRKGPGTGSPWGVGKGPREEESQRRKGSPKSVYEICPSL